MKQEITLISAKNNLNDKTLYKNCFDNNGSNKKIEKIEWLLFNNNKLWINFAKILYPVEKVVGIIAALPLKLKYFNETVYSGQYLDTMTDKDHRGKGLFVTLAKQSYLDTTNDGSSIAWGFPNSNAAHGWFTKLGWKPIADVPFIIKPLKISYLKNKINSPLKKLIPNISFYLNFKPKENSKYSICSINHFNEEYNDIWKEFSENINIAVERNAEYLNWRYIQKPFEDYKILAIKNNQTNQTEAFIVFCVKEKHGGKIGYIMEFIFRNGKEIEANKLLKKAVYDIYNLKAEVILSWAFSHSPNYSIFKKQLFFKLPKKLQFIKLHFGAKILNNNVDEKLFDVKNWYLSYSDSDTV